MPARRLGLQAHTASGAAQWGGDALRRGGAQHLAAAGIDVWRIQALARHSSNAILGYLDGVHARNLGNIAAEASMGRSIDSIRSELRALSDRVTREQAKVHLSSCMPASVAPAVALDPLEVLPELASKPLFSSSPEDDNSGYVISRGPRGRAHLRKHGNPDRTWCGWWWNAASGATLSQTTGDCTVCAKCTRAALQRFEQSSSSGSE